MAASNTKIGGWQAIITAITTPLGLFVLALLIIEGTLTIVLTLSKLPSCKVWTGFLWMTGIFIGVIIIVSILTVFYPTNLLFGKEEHSADNLDSSALQDQIEDLISKNVKSECLNLNNDDNRERK